MNLKIVLNQEFLFEPPKNRYLNQTIPKNTCQIFQPKIDHPRYREIWSAALGFKNARKGMLSTGEERASLFTPFSTGN